MQTLEEWCLKHDRKDLLEDYRRAENPIPPEKLTGIWNLKKKYNWKCADETHPSFPATFPLRARKDRGTCPYCSGRKAIPGVNDLFTVEKNGLMKQWDWEKNNELGLDPHKLLPQSNEPAYWTCEFGHTKLVPIYSKYNSNGGCSECLKYLETSFPEKAVLFYVSQKLIDTKSNYHPAWMKGKELDIYIPSLKTAIEYDGKRFHKDTQKDIRKNNLCEGKEIKLIRIREPGCPRLPKNCICINLPKYNYNALSKAIEELFNHLGIVYDEKIDVSKDEIAILNMINYQKKKNSLAEKYPKIAEEWDYEKNGKVTPDTISCKTNRTFYWKCLKGHDSWPATVASRTSGTGCPVCAGNVFVKGINDLATKSPETAKLWDYTRNSGRPEDYSYSSKEVVWWVCDKGHSWDNPIVTQRSDDGCPVCANRRLVVGVNDLKSRFPAIAAEWDYEKNNGLRPEDFLFGNNERVYWKCKYGHPSWRTSISNRTLQKTKCPYCSGRKAWSGHNDLATVNPEVAALWDYDKNAKTPDKYLPKSNVPAWWKCEKGHSWKTKICTQKKNNGCPICNNKQLLVGFNDLKSQYPDIAVEWDYEKNGELRPEDVTYGAAKDVWWKCKKGHPSWRAEVYRRVGSLSTGTKGNNCPFCSGLKAIPGENDIGTLFPMLVQEWDEEKNKGSICSVKTKSGLDAWWLCPHCGHSYHKVVRDRTKRRTPEKCPSCHKIIGIHRKDNTK